MRGGDGFTSAQRLELSRALDEASEVSGLRFRLYVGVLEGGRAGAQALLAACGADAAETVLVAIDPAARCLEIVTGSIAAETIDDRSCALASLTMTTSFAAGDLTGGIRTGVQMLGAHARGTPRRHLDTL